MPPIQDMPAHYIMDPASRLALFNPDSSVRGGAVERLGKVYGVKSMKKWESEEKEAKDRMERLRSEGAPNPPWTDEEKSAFNRLVHVDRLGSEEVEEEEEEEEDEEEVEEEKEEGKVVPGGTEPAGLENEGERPVAGAAAAAGEASTKAKKPVEQQQEEVRCHFTNMLDDC